MSRCCARSMVTRSLLVATAVALPLLSACKPKPTPIAAKKLVLPDSAEQMIFGFRVVLTTDGVKKGLMLADTAFLYQQGGSIRAELKRVNVTFFTPEGVDDGTMTGREGTWIESLKRIEGRGSVIIIRKDGNRLESPQLVFDNARNQIFSDSSFVLTRPSKPGISGIGFESDPKLTNLRCIKNCKVFGAVRVPK